MREKSTCKNCHSIYHELYTKLTPRIFGQPFEIHCCKDCGVGWTVPEPSTSLEHYVDADRPEIISEAVIGEMREAILSLIEGFWLIHGRAPKSMLDVGCGNGLMLFVAQEAGLEVLGIEPSLSMCQKARQKGVKVSQCALEDFNGYAKFDLIVLNSVVEHLPEPSLAIRALTDRIGNQTVLVFQQAVFDGLLPRLFKRMWYEWAPGEHFWHYTERSFERFIQGQGLNVAHVVRNNLCYQFIPLHHIRHWKSFVYSNCLKLISILARMTRRGDSLVLFAIRKQEPR